MQHGRTLQAAGGFFTARLLKKKKPLIVGWAITDQCNRKCDYCSIWRRPNSDLPTPAILRIVDALAEAGALRISFTGGEPLLRQDMGEIIRYVHEKGIETKMNSNGALVKEKIGDLHHLDMLTLSLEGPEEIHDAIRGRGSFAEVREALQAARENGLKVGLATVLTAANIDAIDFLLDTAGQEGCRVMFQPATPTRLGSRAQNDLAPLVKPYRDAIAGLIDKKKAGNKNIGNSVSGLRHLQKWPDPTPMTCACGWISCRIEPDGRVLYCSRESLPVLPVNCSEAPFKKAFDNLKPMVCNDCWCAARVELNLAFSLNLPTIMNQLNTRTK